jgi:hypothetical protein
MFMMKHEAQQKIQHIYTTLKQRRDELGARRDESFAAYDVAAKAVRFVAQELKITLKE